ncbi:MAG: cellulase family glycosylhydrolase [Planctomycetes bacterium]|nr:cellulase family glycosylhydrolase [Planctomycetota bacterium]
MSCRLIAEVNQMMKREEDGRHQVSSGRGVFLLPLLAMLFLRGPCVAEPPIDPPITVGPNGTILKGGKPYRAIGINYFNAFYRTVENPNDTSYREGFDELSKRGIPFIRFMGGGFSAKNWKMYQDDKAAYFAIMDAFVKAAEEKGIGLIPSLFWWTAGIPDLVDEPRNQWGNPDSKTIAFMRQYVRDVVTRYVNSPAIWAWEFGNEFSLECDLSNAADLRPWVHLDLGTRKERTAEDDLTQEMVVAAFREFAQEVRKVDTKRPISPGHSLPRPAALHLHNERSWTHDNPEQLAANLIEVNPATADLVSVHIYPMDKDRFGRNDATYAETITVCLAAAAKNGQAIFVGEFGAMDSEQDGGAEKARSECLEMISAVESTGVPLAALWVYDLAAQDNSINVTPTNKRSYLLEELTKANRRLQEADATRQRE